MSQQFSSTSECHPGLSRPCESSLLQYSIVKTVGFVPEHEALNANGPTFVAVVTSVQIVGAAINADPDDRITAIPGLLDPAAHGLLPNAASVFAQALLAESLNSTVTKFFKSKIPEFLFIAETTTSLFLNMELTVGPTTARTARIRRTATIVDPCSVRVEFLSIFDAENEAFIDAAVNEKRILFFDFM